MSELSRQHASRRYEAGIGFVSLKHGFHDFRMQGIEKPGLTSVKFNLIPQDDRDKIAWISFFQQISTTQEQPAYLKEIPGYARYEYNGQLIALETILVTERTPEQTVFTSKSEIMSTGKLSPYAQEWLGLLAQQNIDTFNDLYPLLP